MGSLLYAVKKAFKFKQNTDVLVPAACPHVAADYLARTVASKFAAATSSDPRSPHRNCTDLVDRK